MKKTLFITGASGFIGSNFVEFALRKGFYLKALTRDSSRVKFDSSIEWIEGNLASEENWTKYLSSVDVIVHIGAEIHEENLMQEVNYDGPLRLLNCAKEAGVRRWVQLSSVGGYGQISQGVVDEKWVDDPVGLYEKTKSDFDSALINATKFSSLEVCILRPSNIYGPGMRNQSIKEMLNAIKKHVFAFVGPEGASANYIHVQDVVHAIDLCVTHPNAVNQTYIVSTWGTMEDVVAGLVRGAGLAFPSRRIPLYIANLLATIMSWCPYWPLTRSRVRAMSSRVRFDTTKIEKELGWKLTLPVKEGMHDYARGSRG